MKIKTVEKLEDRIIEDFTWRKFELLQLKLAIKNNNTFVNKETFIRTGVALLCAHWEGLIRTVANYYVVFISAQNIKCNNLTENFLALKLKSDFMITSESSKNSVHVKFLEKIEEQKNSTFYFRYSDSDGKRIINTESNLSYKLFVEILKTINIENKYETKKNYIDSEMLKVRHEIVHGEKVKLEAYDFDTIYEQVISIMEDFIEQIIKAAENKRYLKV